MSFGQRDTMKNPTLFDDVETDKSAGAHFSDCRTWRYALWRHWDWQGYANCAMFIGLNPSRADEHKNDTTISKCIGFAKRWGYGGIYMLNLYAFAATYPIDMVQSEDPIGPGNDEAFGYYRSRVGLIVACWGSLEVRYRPRVQWHTRIQRVMDCVAAPVDCLGTTQDASPRHPSRLAYATAREPFWNPNP
jgi:hypothetical protein